MATYFISPTGKDHNPGTESRPWKTVNKAATTAVAGDTVIYEDGTYDIGTQQASWNSGSAGSGYITHQARNSRQAIWEQTTYTTNPIVLTGESYIRFEGIVFQQQTITDIGKFIHLDGCDNIALDDCKVTNTSPHCIMIEDGCSNITINDCDLHAETSTVGVGRNGILIYGPRANTNIVIENCRIYHNPHTGISSNRNCSSSDTYTIRYNEIYDNDSHGLSLYQCASAEVKYNTIHGNGSWPTANNDNEGVRINEGANVEVAFNDLYENTGTGVQMSSNAGTVYVYNNTLVANNTAGDDNGSIGILYNTNTDASLTIKNNIIYHAQSGRRSLYTESRAEACITAMDYNLWYDSRGEETMRRNGTTYGTCGDYQAAGYEPNSVMSSDPLFVDQANHDFTLRATSLAIDAGTDVGYSDDTATPDIGAHPHKKPEPKPTRLLLSLSVADDQGHSLGQFEFEVTL